MDSETQDLKIDVRIIVSDLDIAQIAMKSIMKQVGV